ncbi:Brp/Blh family beta-carotene 15,15'-dioxygenase [Cryobacterium sp. TMT3-29-2]|uniref:Brp/Blh family beta-carotene 15,15'-dioxygenase n=1 Tax=Cryobacterium sp. TMT3-29-2 TaxID=2555867 RepID=UPI0010730375|nr:Brp/Blh family beta-carotene 15,15'-dioxygenase [Cryobacterium sp. TMT3-29-2]TFC84327.1 hypothetical protein E3O67_13480 [Cryobacterium sp. TMT3-29-2]
MPRAGPFGTRYPAWRTGFTAVYILVVVGVMLLWLVAPVASLAAFLLVSALHFGSDWNSDRSVWLRFLAGFGLLTVPALSHPDQVSAIYVVLAGDPGASVAGVQEWLGPLAVAGLLLAAVVAVRHRPHESVEIVFATVLALVTEPLVFFLLYFCALHSFRHLKGGFRDERGNGRHTALVVVAYTVVPLLAVGTFLVAFGPGAGLSDQIPQLVFIDLAGLTVPHMIVVTYEDRRRRAAGAVGSSQRSVRGKTV